MSCKEGKIKDPELKELLEGMLRRDKKWASILTTISAGLIVTSNVMFILNGNVATTAVNVTSVLGLYTFAGASAFIRAFDNTKEKLEELLS